MTKRCYLFAIVATIMATVHGCGYNKVSNDEVDAEEVATSFVSLSEVSNPVWDIEFLKVYSDEGSYSVKWGTGDCWIDERSGFPGFGYPVVCYAVPVKDSTVAVETGYGWFSFTKVDEYSVLVVDGKVVTLAGNEVVDFDKKEELLVLVGNGYASVYRLESGPIFTK